MADPKIRYDIEANVAGNAEVGKLATQIEQLASTLDGDLKTSALASADALRQLAQKDGAIQNFVDLKREAQQAATGLTDAQAAAQKLGAELSTVATPTRAQAGQLQKLRDAVRDAKTEVTAKTVALMQARTGMAQYGVSTDNLSQSQRNIKTAIAAARTEVQAMAPAWQSAAAGAAASAGQQVQSARQIENGLDKLKSQLSSLRTIAVTALGGSYLGSLAKDVADTADAYNNLQARIKLVTGEGALFASSFQSVSEVALRTNSNLEQTGTLFTRIAEAGRSAGLGAQEAAAQSLGLTETINQTVQLSGGSADSAKAAITQLIQGLQSGVLRGEEFNSVMEQSPRLAKALAEGLGVTTGELRKMANAGALTTDVVIGALKAQSDAIKTEFSSLPPTVGRAIENLSTSWTLYVGETDKATGASSAAARAIGALSNNLSTVAGFLLDAGQAAAALAAIRLAQYFAGTAVAATQATAAVVANTAAVTAAGAASNVAGVGVSRFASLLGGLKTFTLIGLVTNFHDIGTAIGEGAAKLMGFKDRTLELAAAEKISAQMAADTVAMRERMAAATQAAIDKQFDLTAAGGKAIAEFDKLTIAGSNSAEAVAKIGKDFDLSTIPGIQNASRVLNKLAADGKISAGEFQAAWSDALKGQDLAVFEAKFQAGMLQLQADAETAAKALSDAIARGLSGEELKEFEDKARGALGTAAREAERLGQVIDVTLRESIKRTGLDFDVISGGMGKASRSALNDTEAMISGLNRLKAMGVDTAQVLTASIGKGIDTADTQQALDAVRLQIEAVRKVLGDQVADGLLDQATTKAQELGDALDKARPGVNGLREAMKELGVVSDQTLKDTAAKSKTAYEEMKNHGKASIRELADGFKKYAADAINANKGVATEALKAEAGMRGLEIQTDRTGRTIIKSMGEGSDALRGHRGEIESVIGAYRKLAGEAYEATSAVGKLAIARRNAAVDAGQFLVAGQAEDDAKRADAMQNRSDAFGAQQKKNSGSYSVQSERTIYDNAKSQGLTDAQALQLGKQMMPTYGQSGSLIPRANGENWHTDLQKEIDRLILQNARAASTNSGAQSGNGSTTSPAKTYTVNIVTDGRSRQYTAASDADAQALIRQLQTSKLSSGI